MARMLFIVSVYRPDVYSYARDAFRAVTADLEVIMDRRVGERRRPGAGAVEPDRRQRSDRRRQNIEERLRTIGWAAVPLQESRPARSPAR